MAPHFNHKMIGEDRSNILTFTIPGTKKKLNISFPPRRLPCCTKCKGHYKTREMCRERKKHTGLPWNSVYLCLTLDKSCIGDNDTFVDGTFISKVTSPRNCQLKDDQEIDTNMPMCSSCKQKNYTCTSCRGTRYKHRQLPWNTVYGDLFLVPDTKIESKQELNRNDDDKDVNKDENVTLEQGDKKRKTKEEKESPTKKSKPNSESEEKAGDKSFNSNDKKENCGEVLSKVDQSRTFFFTISPKSCSIVVSYANLNIWPLFCDGMF